MATELSEETELRTRAASRMPSKQYCILLVMVITVLCFTILTVALTAAGLAKEIIIPGGGGGVTPTSDLKLPFVKQYYDAAPGSVISTIGGNALLGLQLRQTCHSEIATVYEEEQYPSSMVFGKGWTTNFVVAYPLTQNGQKGVRFIPGHHYDTTEGFDHDWNGEVFYPINTTCTDNIELLHLTFAGVCLEANGEARRLESRPANDDYQIGEMYMLVYSCEEADTHAKHINSLAVHYRPKGNPYMWVPNDRVVDWGVHENPTRDSVAVSFVPEYYEGVIAFADTHTWWSISSGDFTPLKSTAIPVYAQGEDTHTVAITLLGSTDVSGGMPEHWHVFVAGPCPSVTAYMFKWDNGTQIINKAWEANMNSDFFGNPHIVLLNETGRRVPTGMAVGYKTRQGPMALMHILFDGLPAKVKAVDSVPTRITSLEDNDYTHVALFQDLSPATNTSIVVVLSGDSEGTATVTRYRPVLAQYSVNAEWASFRPVVQLVTPDHAKPNALRVHPIWRTEPRFGTFYLLALETYTPVMSEWAWMGGMHFAGITKTAPGTDGLVTVQREGVFSWTKECGAPLVAGSPYYSNSYMGQLTLDAQGDSISRCHPRVGFALSSDKLMIDSRDGCFDPLMSM